MGFCRAGSWWWDGGWFTRWRSCFWRGPRQPLDLGHKRRPVVLVAAEGWDRLTEKALRFSMWRSTDVIAVHISNLSGEEAAEEDHRVRREWAQDVEAPARAHGVLAPTL